MYLVNPFLVSCAMWNWIISSIFINCKQIVVLYDQEMDARIQRGVGDKGGLDSPWKITPAPDAIIGLPAKGAQWLSGRVLVSRPKGSGFEPHRRHCVVVLEQDTFILA